MLPQWWRGRCRLRSELQGREGPSWPGLRREPSLQRWELVMALGYFQSSSLPRYSWRTFPLPFIRYCLYPLVAARFPRKFEKERTHALSVLCRGCSCGWSGVCAAVDVARRRRVVGQRCTFLVSQCLLFVQPAEKLAVLLPKWNKFYRCEKEQWTEYTMKKLH